MGGHGALICFLKNPGLYKSVSAFAPICNPTECPWGTKALAGYLGDKNKDAWKVTVSVCLPVCNCDCLSTLACVCVCVPLCAYMCVCFVVLVQPP